jgi:hypothetical protein
MKILKKMREMYNHERPEGKFISVDFNVLACPIKTTAYPVGVHLTTKTIL